MKSVRMIPVALATLALATPAFGAPSKKSNPPGPEKRQSASAPLLDLSRWLDDGFRDLEGTWETTGGRRRTPPPASSEAPPCYEIDRTKCPIG